MLYSLTAEEKQLALAEAQRRQEWNASRNKKGRNLGASRGLYSLFIHKVGCGGEMAVASYLGMKDFVFKETEPVRGSCDLPFNIDVKTRTRHYYDLLIQLDDEPWKVYWLVTLENKQFNIHGWTTPNMEKKNDWILEPLAGRRAYFIPKKELKRPEEFWDYHDKGSLYCI